MTYFSLNIIHVILQFGYLKWALHIYIWSRDSTKESVILHRHVSTVAQNGQVGFRQDILHDDNITRSLRG